jgi:hypothetical protein
MKRRFLVKGTERLTKFFVVEVGEGETPEEIGAQAWTSDVVDGEEYILEVYAIRQLEPGESDTLAIQGGA